ncbi:MAG: thermonuclease family protein [Clostridiales bacterium]|nr:thermonuclease family protein [Clostridiales bacterium]
MKNISKSILLTSILLFALTSFGCTSQINNINEANIPSYDDNTRLDDKDLSFLDAFEKTTVTRVVDGDTIVISSGEKVRFILVNTPESVHPDDSKNTEFGTLASDYTKEKLLDQTIYMEKDISETDRYGRLLRYIYLGDGTFFNELLVKEGYAQLSTFPPDLKYLEMIQAAETYARENDLGLWAYEEDKTPPVSKENGRYIGSVKSDKFHELDCRHIESILETNRLYFDTISDATDKGYIPCKACNPNN